jgi:hypothetical protein
MASTIEIGFYQPRSEDSQSYTAGWKHLEMWTPVGTAKLLQSKRIGLGNGHDDLGSQHRLAIVEKNLNPKVAQRALQATLQEFYTQTCSHEHDCCGCHTATVEVRHRGGRTYSVISHHGRNF